MRGQITFIVIIAILILLAIAGVAYVLNTVKNVSPKQTNNNAQMVSLQSCLSSQLDKAVEDVSLHGGIMTSRIYAPFTGNTFLDYGKVSYWIMRPPLSYYERVNYLYTISSVATSPQEATDQQERGTAHIPPLYSDSRYTVDSLQKAVHDSLASQVSGCSPYYNSTDPNIVVDFADKYVEAIYNMKISGSSSFQKIAVKANVPLKLAYMTAKSAVTAEATETIVNGQFHHNFSNINSNDFIIHYRQADNNHNDSLVILQSKSAVLGGRPYQFVFAVEDRPALVVSKKTNPSSCSDILGVLDPDEGDNKFVQFDITEPTNCTYTHSQIRINYVYHKKTISVRI